VEFHCSRTSFSSPRNISPPFYETLPLRVYDTIGPNKNSIFIFPIHQVRFYNEVVQEFRGFNEAWRRHLAHAHKDSIYDRDYAKSVMGHVKKFMEKLATKISENSTTPPCWASV
jgi:hypothetical protein